MMSIAPRLMSDSNAPPAVAQRRQRLLMRIRRQYQVASQVVRLGNLEIPFVRIADPDRVLDAVAAEEDRREKRTGQRLAGEELHLPYWAELWESAIGVGQFLAGPRGGQVIGAEMNVLDLGCGMGLAGTIAAALGGRVLFGDLEPAALLFAQLNSLPWPSRVRTRRMNWRTDDLGERFSLIIGADILYERAQWQHLESFWRRHLSENGRVLLGEPGRQTGDLFVPWIAEQGWRLTQHEEPVATRPRPVRLFVLEREGPPTNQRSEVRGQKLEAAPDLRSPTSDLSLPASDF